MSLSLALSLGLNRGWAAPFSPLELNPYLFVNAEDSPLSPLQLPALDLDPSYPAGDIALITATNSNGTYINADGDVTAATANTVRIDQTRGEELTPAAINLVAKSNDYDEAPWTLTTDITLTETATASPVAGKNAFSLVADNLANSQRLIQTITTDVSGDTYTVSIYAKPFGYTEIFIYVAVLGGTGTTTIGLSLADGTVTLPATSSGDFSSPSASSEELADGWYRVSFTFTVASAGTALNISTYPRSSVNNLDGNGVDGILIGGHQVESGSATTDFIPNTTGVPLGVSATHGPRVPMILAEPAVVQMLSYSEPTIAQSSTQGAGLTDDATDDRGLGHWIQFPSDVSGVVHWVKPPLTTAIDGVSDYVISCFVRMDDGGAPVVGTSTVGDMSFSINGSTTAGTAGGVEDLGGGLYRIWAYSAAPPVSTNNGVLKYTTQSTRGFKVSGFQMEKVTVNAPSSYIPATGSGATRTADVYKIDGTNFSDFWNATEGTAYVEAVGREVVSTREILNFSDGTADERIASRYYSNNHLVVVSGGLTQANLDAGTFTANTLGRVAASWEADNMKVSLDGGAEATQGATATMSTVTQLNIGSRFDGTLQLNGHIKRLLYWPTHSDNL